MPRREFLLLVNNRGYFYTWSIQSWQFQMQEDPGALSMEGCCGVAGHQLTILMGLFLEPGFWGRFIVEKSPVERV